MKYKPILVKQCKDFIQFTMEMHKMLKGYGI